MDQLISKPIILLVSERSGSNLLRTLLGNHKSICAPIAPHFLNEFYDYRKYYGDLRNSENSANLISDMLKVANHKYNDWKLEIDIKKIAESSTSVISAFHHLYSEKAKQENKTHYCSKGIKSFKYLDILRAELENVKFIHLVRDPRDVVASWAKRPILGLSVYENTINWKMEQELLIDALISKGMSCLQIKYEDLIANTKKIMEDVQKYIGVEIDPSCFDTDKKNQESKRNPFWENLSKPILKENSQKFRKELSEEEIIVIETVAKKEMKFFDYEPITEANWKPGQHYHPEHEKEKKKDLVHKLNQEMEDLKDKVKMINQLRQNRIAKWQNEEIKFDFSKKEKNNGNVIRDRLKYLSYSILGQEMTKKIKSKFK